MMIDKSDLRLSDLYFAISQILGIAADWIQESMDDLHRTFNDMERLYLNPNSRGQFATFVPREWDTAARAIAVERFKRNRERVTSHQRRIGVALLARIAKKQEDVKSRRDGVSARL